MVYVNHVLQLSESAGWLHVGLRVIDSLQLTAKHQVATPVNWEPGEDVIIAGSVSDDEAKRRYPHGWKAPKPYIRIVPQPQ
jgi:alkyl hydroperoxide reductase subunit AhpC